MNVAENPGMLYAAVAPCPKTIPLMEPIVIPVPNTSGSAIPVLIRKSTYELEVYVELFPKLRTFATHTLPTPVRIMEALTVRLYIVLTSPAQLV